MGFQQDDFDDTWAGLEPPRTRPGTPQWAAWLAAGLAVLFLACVCVAGTYVLLQQFQGPGSPAPPPPPTPAGDTTVPAPDVVATPTAVPAAAEATPVPPLTVAPTVTLPGDAAAPPATATLPGPVLPPAVGGGNVEAQRVGAPPGIDGELAEWADFPAYESAYVIHRAAGVTRAPTLRAVWRLGWDDQYLYVAVAVEDDVHVQNQADNLIFRGDSVEMQFETNYERRSSRIGPSNFQIIMSPGDFGALPPSAFRFRGNEQGQIRDYTGHNIIVAARQTAVGYNLEAAIPWVDLHHAPAAGQVLGLALNANDNDTPGTAVQEMMMSNVPTRTLTDPTSWGTLTLR
jgi:hypothetical protein